MAKVIYGRNRLLLTAAELREVLMEVPCGEILDCTALKQAWNWYNGKTKEVKADGNEGNEG